MAKAFPNSQFIGYDFHPSSIEHARAHAREHGVAICCEATAMVS